MFYTLLNIILYTGLLLSSIGAIALLWIMPAGLAMLIICTLVPVASVGYVMERSF